VPPETQYARLGDAYVAYQVFGDGPMDLVLVPPIVSHVEWAWESPNLAGFLERLSSFARVMMFDKRGTGMSDPMPGSGVPTLEERIDDVTAVMDACDSKSATLLGYGEGGPVSILFAATHPSRTTSLVLCNTAARLLRADDYEWGWIPEHNPMDDTAPVWGTGGGMYRFTKLAEDPEFIKWYSRWERLSASPGIFNALRRVANDIDVRAVLGTITAPTLVMHAVDNQILDVRHGRYLAEHIPGARYIEVPGFEHYPWFEDSHEYCDEVEEFVTGVRPAPDTDRVLCTVMFTDIVGSTALAAETGDARWRETLARHNTIVRREIERFRGREVDNAGDGFLATFDGPARAVRCAWAIGDNLRGMGLQLRAGVHTGECEIIGPKVAGIAVHIAARIAAMAGPGEVLASSTVKDLVAGSGIHFADRGAHALKGVPEEWRVYASER
jgi:pimeloyl-ACP methyl ester carboxylesterase/class 3 adenylate cyclase